MDDRCVSCGVYVPEGRMVCLNCETKTKEQTIRIKKMPELKPCPFCGGKSKVRTDKEFFLIGNEKCSIVFCESCQAIHL